MDAIHKLITLLTSPLTVGLLLLIVGMAVFGCKSRRWGLVGIVVALAWMWGWSMPATCRWLGLSLEMRYPPRLAEELPSADAIAILGGGMGANTNVYPYAEMWSGADRVWHGARLYKAGKAPIIMLSGGGVKETTVPLLRDLGVPDSALLFNESAKNTEDEANLIVTNIVTRMTNEPQRKPSVLLVTSAWHMRRAELLFRKAGLDVIPAATDYETLVRCGENKMELGMFIPDANYLGSTTALFKEHFAYWCYRIKFWIQEL